MKDDIALLWQQLDTKRRRQFVFIILFMFFGAFAELFSLGSVVPFLSLMTGSDESNTALIFGIDFSAIFPVENQKLLVTILFVVFAAVAAFVRLSVLWLSTKFVYGVGHDLSSKMFKVILAQPYQYHVENNSSHVLGALSKIQLVTSGYLYPTINIITSSVIILFIISSLLLISPVIALSGVFFFGFSYFILAYFSKMRIRKNGVTIARMNDLRVKTVQEGIGGIRDIILDQSQIHYSNQFNSIDSQFRNAQGVNSFLGKFPRIAIEGLSLVMVGGFAFLFSGGEGSFAQLLPVLGVLGLAAQKLMPLVQQMYDGWVQMSTNSASTRDVLSILTRPVPLVPFRERVPFNKSLELRSVSFEYTGAETKPVLDKLSLQIEKGDCVGIVGSTGSGKSTLIDLLMGLLPPSNGGLFIDQKRIEFSDIDTWRKNVAHVPQNIYLFDSTILENIVLASGLDEVDESRLFNACRDAQILDYIQSLPDGFSSPTGERGVQMSGGQRQRLGLARALYKNCDVLILDEATSALDDETERRVIEALRSSESSRTVIMIAHRLSSLKYCNKIFRVENGQVNQTVLE
jgi:ABC-type multidrug transport system fused ATPase/permease subunit